MGLMDILITIGVTVVSGIILAVGAMFTKRIEKLEEQVHKNITEDSVRQIISDKVDPLKEDLSEIKDNLRILMLPNFRGKHNG